MPLALHERVHKRVYMKGGAKILSVFCMSLCVCVCVQSAIKGQMYCVLELRCSQGTSLHLCLFLYQTVLLKCPLFKALQNGADQVSLGGSPRHFGELQFKFSGYKEEKKKWSQISHNKLILQKCLVGEYCFNTWPMPVCHKKKTHTHTHTH